MKEYELELIKRWREKRVFNTEFDMFKAPKLIIPEFEEVFGRDLNNYTIYSYLFCDIYNRYHKMNGKNVMFSVGVSDLIQKSQDFYKSYYMNSKDVISKYRNTLDLIGVGYDPKRFISYRDPGTISYIQRKFLNDFYDHIKVKNDFVLTDDLSGKIYNKFDTTKLGEDYYINNTKLSLRYNTYLSLDISNMINDILNIIRKANIEDKYKKLLFSKLGLNNELHLELSNSYDIKLDVKVKNPELIAGISQVVLNPSKMDVMPFVSFDEREYVLKYIQNGYSKGVLSGLSFVNPITGKDIIICISYDIEDDYKLIIPSKSKEDAQICEYFGIDYINVVENGLITNSDFLDGLDEQSAREKVIEVFLNEGIGYLKEVLEVDEIILSDFDDYGIQVPLYLKENDSTIYKIDISELPLLKARNRAYSSSQSSPLEISFNNLFLDGLNHIISTELENSLLKKSRFSGENTYLLSEDNLISHFLMPELFDLILNEENDKEKYLVFKKNKLDDAIALDYERKEISFSSDILNVVSADSYRLFLLHGNKNVTLESSLNDINNYELKLQRFIEVFDNEFNNDSKLEEEFNSLKEKLNRSIDEKNIVLYIDDLFSFVNNNKREITSKAMQYSLLKFLSLICPFISQKVYEEKFNGNYFIVYEAWPK